MPTIAENIETIRTSVADIKSAIEAKGVEVSGDITTYADLINDIGGNEGAGSLDDFLSDSMTHMYSDVKILPGYSICYRNNLEFIDFKNLEQIDSISFYNCNNLKTVIIRTNKKCKSNSSLAFYNCAKINNGEGSIYVPDNLLEEYLNDRTWGGSSYIGEGVIKSLNEYVE